VAGQYTEAYLKDSSELGIKPADINPKATDHISGMIGFIEKLVAKGKAYVVDGDVFFDIKSFPQYGKLSGRNIEEDTMAGARIEVDERKRNPEDFALWKSAKPGEPSWDSPWGKGRPGWHIECSAMSMKYLGETLDIHAGGSDLNFPHHENEIAQSEALTGKQFAKYWLHGALLKVDGRRMGKSEGNFIFVREALKKYERETIRLFLISAHYRSPLNYTEESIQEMTNAVSRIRNSLDNMNRFALEGELQGDLSDDEDKLSKAIEGLRERFTREMDDDFNTAGAIGAIFEFVGEVNTFIADNQGRFTDNGRRLLGIGYETAKELCDIFGIYHTPESSPQPNLASQLMDLVIELRQEARTRKDWDTADKIRGKLSEMGIKIEDTREGTIWKRE
jgi:cysteinyl-tRNA synthetase